MPNCWHSSNQHGPFCIYIKGHNFAKKPCRVLVLGQIVALVMVNKHMKFDKIYFNTYKVIAKLKVCHADDNDDNNYAAANDDTRVMIIPRGFFLWKTAELKRCNNHFYRWSLNAEHESSQSSIKCFLHFLCSAISDHQTSLHKSLT